MAEKHTPTPWAADLDSGYVFTRPSPLTRFVIVEAESGLASEKRANVALIVRAVNSHDKLVEALEKLVAWKHAVDTVAPELGGLLVAIYNAEAVLSSLQTQEEGR